MGGQSPLPSGFSLVEVMVTVFILGMATSFVVATLPENPSPLIREARKFEAYVELAAKRSRVSGLPTGLVVTSAGYSLVVWRDRQWNAVTGTDHTLGGGVRIAEGDTIASGHPEDWPVVQFDPLGAVTPATVQFRTAGKQVSVVLSPDGSAELDDDHG